MCTLTWLINEQGYEVFFNRDEQRSRKRAIPPSYDKTTDSIMPIDTQGNGTWIAANRSGVTLCLLNNYQAEANIEKNNFISRGSLIPLLFKNKYHEQILQQLQEINLQQYMPFWFCIFPETLNKSNKTIYIYQWDGKTLTKEDAAQPMISSAISLLEVKQERINLFKKMVKFNTNSKQHLAYHCSHQPEKGKLSVCMHRNDAHTQSLSHITISNDITFRYHDAAPCMNLKYSEVLIKSDNKI